MPNKTTAKSDKLNIIAASTALELAGTFYGNGYTENEYKAAVSKQCDTVHQNWDLFTRAVEGDPDAIEQIAGLTGIPPFAVEMSLMDASLSRESAQNDVG